MPGGPKRGQIDARLTFRFSLQVQSPRTRVPRHSSGAIVERAIVVVVETGRHGYAAADWTSVFGLARMPYTRGTVTLNLEAMTDVLTGRAPVDIGVQVVGRQRRGAVGEVLLLRQACR